MFSSTVGGKLGAYPMFSDWALYGGHRHRDFFVILPDETVSVDTDVPRSCEVIEQRSSQARPTACNKRDHSLLAGLVAPGLRKAIQSIYCI